MYTYWALVLYFAFAKLQARLVRLRVRLAPKADALAARARQARHMAGGRSARADAAVEAAPALAPVRSPALAEALATALRVVCSLCTLLEATFAWVTGCAFTDWYADAATEPWWRPRQQHL